MSMRFRLVLLTLFVLLPTAYGAEQDPACVDLDDDRGYMVLYVGTGSMEMGEPCNSDVVAIPLVVFIPADRPWPLP